MQNILLKTIVVAGILLALAGIGGVIATFIAFWAGVINIGTSGSVTLWAIVKLLFEIFVYGATSYGMIIFGAYISGKYGDKLD